MDSTVREATPLITCTPGNPKRQNPVLQATRISVSDVLGVPGQRACVSEDILADFPDLRVEPSSGCVFELRGRT